MPDQVKSLHAGTARLRESFRPWPVVIFPLAQPRCLPRPTASLWLPFHSVRLISRGAFGSSYAALAIIKSSRSTLHPFLEIQSDANFISTPCPRIVGGRGQAGPETDQPIGEGLFLGDACLISRCRNSLSSSGRQQEVHEAVISWHRGAIITAPSRTRYGVLEPVKLKASSQGLPRKITRHTCPAK